MGRFGVPFSFACDGDDQPMLYEVFPITDAGLESILTIPSMVHFYVIVPFPASLDSVVENIQCNSSD